MTFVIYFSLTWTLLGLLVFYKSNLPFHMGSFLFLVVCFINTHTYHLLPENFKGFSVNGDLSPYLSYIMWRSILVPAFLVFCYKLFYFQKNLFGNILFTAIFYSLLMTLLEQFGDYMGIFTFQWWNFIFAFCYYFALFFLSYLLLSGFLRMGESKEYVG